MYYIWLNKNGDILSIMRAELAPNTGMSEEELLKNGVYIDSIPEAEIKPGFDPIMKYGKEKGLYYDYTPRPLNFEEQLKSLGEQLAQEKLKNIQKDATISQLGQELAKLKLEVIQIQGGM